VAKIRIYRLAAPQQFPSRFPKANQGYSRLPKPIQGFLEKKDCLFFYSPAQKRSRFPNLSKAFKGVPSRSKAFFRKKRLFVFLAASKPYEGGLGWRPCLGARQTKSTQTG
jgi:hypothetical protein